MWFSALLQLEVSVGGKPTSMSRTVVVFEAGEDWAEAEEKARTLGRSKEQSYANSDRETVRWSFRGLETLDMLGERIEDGREVYHEIVETSASTQFAAPGASAGQSGV